MGFYDAIRVGASGAADSAYAVDRSLRFNDGDSPYLQRTPSSAGNRQICTFSCWVKRGDLNSTNCLASAYSATNDSDNIALNFRELGSGNCEFRVVGYNHNFRITNRLFRDVSAWYHIVVAFDTTQSSADDRIKVYVNGVQETSFSTSGNVTQNMNIAFNDTSVHRIGVQSNALSNYMDGYMAEVNFIDGLQLTPASFGATDVITGQWNPKKYVGSYGTNGFYLNFSDNSGTTATTLGKDSSGNGNNFTPNNFSVAAGDGNDSVSDTPTLNKATLNPITGFTYNATLSEGNLKMSGSSGFKEISTIAVAGTSKFYYEVVNTERNGWQLVGVFVGQPNNPSNALSNTAVWGFASTQATYYGGSYTSTSDVPSWTNNDVMAIKYENGSLKLYKNGTLQTANTSSVPTGDIVFAYIANDNQNAAAFVRFNSDSWTQASAAGVDSTWELSTANLPDPTILLPNNHFNTLLYTGNDSSDRDITGVGFQPDWLWIKNRQQADWHQLCDAVRGANKVLFSNTTDGESTDNSNGHVNSFLTDGFNVDAGASGNVNENNEDYVAWNWNAGDTDGKTYTVTVVSDSGNKYRFDGFGTSAVTLDLAEGGTYIFNYPSAHPLKFSTTSDGTHGGGSEYTTGVTHNSSTQVTIVVAASAPQLYYYCSIHSGMGGAVNTNSTLGSSNFDGSKQTVVKANASAGFSIISYTGDGSSGATTGHGLGVAPKIMFHKDRDSSNNWYTITTAIDGSPDYLYLNLTNAKADSGVTAPTSSLVSFTASSESNHNGRDYIMYAFSEVAGYSKVGSYTGNNTANGPFVYTGFRPAWIMVKSISTGGSATYSWSIVDSKRSSYNIERAMLLANSSDSEITSNTADVDLLSNGFKPRHSPNNTNGNNTYIYLAFAEAPFKNARAR